MQNAVHNGASPVDDNNDSTVSLSAVTVQFPIHVIDAVDRVQGVDRTASPITRRRRLVNALIDLHHGNRPDLAVACVVSGSLLISVATCALGVVVAFGY